jgi:glycosyltransferase involved in cell wall biosynthesis
MLITVALCAWNRHAQLRQTLEQMTRLVIPPTVAWELVAVNNNSTDVTEQVLDAFEGRLPLRRLFEPRAGAVHARSLVVREGQGRVHRVDR